MESAYVKIVMRDAPHNWSLSVLLRPWAMITTRTRPMAQALQSRQPDILFP
jgi:hypothetical protein